MLTEKREALLNEFGKNLFAARDQVDSHMETLRLKLGYDEEASLILAALEGAIARERHVLLDLMVDLGPTWD